MACNIEELAKYMVTTPTGSHRNKNGSLKAAFKGFGKIAEELGKVKVKKPKPTIKVNDDKPKPPGPNDTIYIANVKEREQAHIDKKGILTTRIYKALSGLININANFNFGNPFAVNGLKDWTGKVVNDKTQTGPVVSMKFKNWLLGRAHQDVLPAKRNWILQMIDEGRLDDVPLIYWKKVDAPTHDKVLRNLVDNRDKSKKTESVRGLKVDTTKEIYWGNGQNNPLSNLAPRPFTYKGRKYASVEHAYQTLKTGSINEQVYNTPGWEKGGKKAAQGKPRTVSNYNLNLMKQLMWQSFEQNPQAQKELLATKDQILTHNTTNDKVWKEKFPEYLMAIRDKLKTKPTGTNQSQLDKLPINQNDKQYIKNSISLYNSLLNKPDTVIKNAHTKKVNQFNFLQAEATTDIDSTKLTFISEDINMLEKLLTRKDIPFEPMTQPIDNEELWLMEVVAKGKYDLKHDKKYMTDKEQKALEKSIADAQLQLDKINIARQTVDETINNECKG